MKTNNSTLAASGLNVLEREINNELRNLNIWHIVNKLSHIVAKTEFMLIGTRQRLLLQGSKQMQIQIERKNINQVEKATSMGVLIDDNLTWKNHLLDEIFKKISSGNSALKRQTICFIGYG